MKERKRIERATLWTLDAILIFFLPGWQLQGLARQAGHCTAKLLNRRQTITTSLQHIARQTVVEVLVDLSTVYAPCLKAVPPITSGNPKLSTLHSLFCQEIPSYNGNPSFFHAAHQMTQLSKSLLKNMRVSHAKRLTTHTKYKKSHRLFEEY